MRALEISPLAAGLMWNSGGEMWNYGGEMWNYGG